MHAAGEGKRWLLQVLTPIAGAGQSPARSEGAWAAGTSLCALSFTGATLSWLKSSSPMGIAPLRKFSRALP